jgi:hypothetical protein
MLAVMSLIGCKVQTAGFISISILHMWKRTQSLRETLQARDQIHFNLPKTFLVLGVKVWCLGFPPPLDPDKPDFV